MSSWTFNLPLQTNQRPYEPLHHRSTSHELMPWQAPPAASNLSITPSEAASTRSTASLLPGTHPYDRSPAPPRRAGRKSKWNRLRFHGWRVGVSWCAGAATTVLLVNTIWTIWASAAYGLKNGIGTMQNGSCGEAKKLSLWLHFAINFLSTTLLAASNYCMQCLAAPTREEIDKAHGKHKWLDIGVPSVRNLFHIAKTRRLLWWLLALSGVPLHLLYNSAVFSTLGATYYSVYGVSMEIANAPIEDVPKLLDEAKALVNETSSTAYDELVNFRSWEKLSNKDCIRGYGQSFVSSRKTLVLVSSGLNETKPITFLPIGGSVSASSLAYDWMCPSQYVCDIAKLEEQARAWDPGYRESLPVQYCYSQRVEEHCSVQFSVVIMSIVIMANAVKSVCMFLTLWRQKQPPLVTLGDAIQSFLRLSDPTTAHQCLASKNDFVNEKWSRNVLPWKRRRYFWFSGASTTRWLICNILCMVTLGVTGWLLSQGLAGNLQDRSFPYLWKMGFGAITSESMTDIIQTKSRIRTLFLNILVANSPQPLLSFLFLTYNSLYTCMLLTQEWFSYAHQRKALRVTNPRGDQRSTYRLQLPYRYGIPLIILSGVLHWLVSQSLFLVNVRQYSGNSTSEDYEDEMTALGYSCIAIITTILLSSITIATGIAMGFQRYKGGMPLAGSCSAAISAACHQPSQDWEAAELPLMWGVVGGKTLGSTEDAPDLIDSNGGQVGHCSFTSLPVLPPREGMLYSGNTSNKKK